MEAKVGVGVSAMNETPIYNELNLYERELAEWTEQSFATVVGPDDFKATVASLLCGGNFRELSERCLRAYLPCYLSWLMQICYDAKIKSSGSDDWRSQLLGQVTAAANPVRGNKRTSARPTRQQVARELEVILLGLTKKTVDNLDIKGSLQERLAEYSRYINEVCQLQPWGRQFIRLDMAHVVMGGASGEQDETGNVAQLSSEETIWFLQAAGAITLMLRGRFKSLLGKQLESATLVTMLRLLGLKRIGRDEPLIGPSFALNVELKETGSRETDAVVYVPPSDGYPSGMVINIDMELIGSGNQEVTQDKLSRVGAYGVVVVDKLGRNSKVPAAAINLKVALIQLRKGDKSAPTPEPLQDLYFHIERFLAGTLTRPPQGKEQILARMGELEQDGDYRLLFSRLYNQFATTARLSVGSEEANVSTAI